MPMKHFILGWAGIITLSLSGCANVYDKHFEEQRYENEISNQGGGQLSDYKTPARDLAKAIVQSISPDKLKITSLAYRHPFGETLERRLRVLGFSISNKLNSNGTPLTFILDEGR